MNVHRHLAAAIAFATTVGIPWLGGVERAHAQPGLETVSDSRPSPRIEESFRPLYIDFGVRLASAPDSTLMVEPAVELARPFNSYLGLGLGFTGGSAPLISGERHAFSIASSLDLYREVLGHLRGHARIGLAVQYRGGGQLPGGKTVALFGALGARVNLGLCIIRRPGRRSRGCMTAGTEVRLQRAMTGGWLMNPAVLPRGASVLSTSVTFGWEV